MTKPCVDNCTQLRLEKEMLYFLTIFAYIIKLGFGFCRML
jgi:hypothetical protein